MRNNFCRKLIGVALLFPVVASAQLFQRDPWDEEPLPQEEQITLPAAPLADNLLRFDPGRLSTLHFYVDKASLSVGADRIVRYTLVVRGEGDARNVSYEALRCDTGEQKIYAYGKRDGGWSAVSDPEWAPVDKDFYRKTLFDDYFCPLGLTIRNPREGIDALVSGYNPRAVHAPD